MRLGRRDTGQLQIPKQRIRGPNQGQVDGDALLHGGIRTPLRPTVTVGCVGDRLADRGQMVLTVRWLHMRSQLSPVAHPMQAPPEHVPRGPHGGGIDVCLREPAPRRSTAMVWASIVSFLALPPCMAFMERA